MTRAPLRQLERRLLDRRLAELRPLAEIPPPAGGWLSAVRRALGMNLAQMAARLGVSDRAAAQMEQREASGGITLNNLDKAARALGCRVVYALVPQTSLDDQVRAQARHAAEVVIDSVEQSMALEAQANTAETREARIDDLADEIARRGGRDLWRA